VLPRAERRPPAVTAMLTALRSAARDLAAEPQAAALGLRADG
jgi:hypothetical protein